MLLICFRTAASSAAASRIRGARDNARLSRGHGLFGASIRKPLPCRTLVFDPGCAREPVLESEQSLARDSKSVDFPKENYPNQIVQVWTV